MWSVQINFIHIVSAYTIDKSIKELNLLTNKSLSLLFCTKIADWVNFNTSHKWDHSVKTINTDLNDDNISNFYMNHDNQSHFSKKIEENMSVSLKKKCLSEKNSVSVKLSTNMIDAQWAVSSITDKSMKDCIVIKLKWSPRSKTDVVTLNLFILIKFCIKVHHER